MIESEMSLGQSPFPLLKKEEVKWDNLSHEEQYKLIEKDLISKEDSRLRIEMYALGERDLGSTTDDPLTGEKEQEEINSLFNKLKRPYEEKAKELAPKIMAEIFKRNSPPTNETVVFKESQVA